MTRRLFAAAAIVAVAAVPASLADAGGRASGPSTARGGAPTPSVPVLDGQVFFSATGPGGEGYELWRTDGTKAGTKLVKNINPGTDGSFPDSLQQLGQRIVFGASHAETGEELWRTDGTGGGTKLVEDIRPAGDSFLCGMIKLGNRVLFQADDGVIGAELWRTDATGPGTKPLKNIVAGAGGSSPIC
jgi:ELWxxDGT repeat protein